MIDKVDFGIFQKKNLKDTFLVAIKIRWINIFFNFTKETLCEREINFTVLG